MSLSKKHKEIREAYTAFLNELGTPREDLKSEGGRIPDGAEYGTWTRRHDPIGFRVGMAEWYNSRLEFEEPKNLTPVV